MFLESFINQKVQVKFKNLPDYLTGPVTGIYEPDEWYLVKLVKTENMGIWVENPCYKRTKIKEEDGTDIPKEKQKEEECTTNLLIRWEYISSVITFPHEASALGADKQARLIGFELK